MQDYINVTIAQINPRVGDLKENLNKIMKHWDSSDRETHLVIFPELALCGYPPEDLLLRLDFIRECHKALERLLEFSTKMQSMAIVGMPYYEEDLYNALLVVGDGKVWGVYRKAFLPNYSVFDEKRYFRAGREPLVVELSNTKIGFSICEDVWHPDGWERVYALSGCEVLVNINASPYYRGKYEFKESFLKARAEDNMAYMVYVNMVGGQDELVFDGRSLIIDPEGRILARARAFEEDRLTVSLDLGLVRRKRLLDLRLRERQPQEVRRTTLNRPQPRNFLEGRVERALQEEEELYKVITLAIRDYVEKTPLKGQSLVFREALTRPLLPALQWMPLAKKGLWEYLCLLPLHQRKVVKMCTSLSKILTLKCLNIPLRTYTKPILKPSLHQALRWPRKTYRLA